MRSVIFGKVFVVALIPLFASVSQASDPPAGPVATVDWGQLKESGRLKSGEIVLGENGQPDRLKLVNEQAGVRSIPLCELDSPPIKTDSYALRGKIRYENVVGNGFLEMWNHFPGEGEFFSRTMDSSGPMGMVTGSSPEREFILPFHTFGQAPAPKKLAINLVLNGPGTVEIGPLELVPIDSISAGGSDWWSGSTAGLMGGIGGTILGLLGGVIGTLTGVGKGRKLVLSLAATMAGMGTLILIGGIYAAIAGQTYNVFYPLLLLGGMMAIAGTAILCVAPGRFRDHELRRMQALDIS